MSTTRDTTGQDARHEGLTAYDIATIKHAEEAWVRNYQSGGERA